MLSQATFVTWLLFMFIHQVNSSHTCSSDLEGQTRVTDGPNSREGRVDICVSGYWNTPCNDSWGIEEVQVVCRELGFCRQGGMLVTNQIYQHWFPWNLLQVNCSGNETVLRNCSRSYSLTSCFDYVGGGVKCSPGVPETPTDVKISVIDSYFVQVSWSPPDMSNCTDVEEYRVQCDFIQYYTQTEWTSSNSIYLFNFEFRYFDYNCCVSGNNSAGLGPESCVSRPPPTHPRNVSVISSLTTLVLDWTEPEYINGRFDFYQVTCGTQTRYSHRFTQTMLEVTGLSIFTTYMCCVSVYNYVHYSRRECVNVSTYLEPPSIPMNFVISEITTTSVQLEWTTPLYNGTLSHYTIACMRTQDSTEVWLSTAANTSDTENVTNLWPFTNYTCCVSASNQAGEGIHSCVNFQTQPAPPTEPEGFVTISTDISNLTLSWGPPVESYGQAVLFYTLSCESPLNDSVRVERVASTSVRVPGLMPHTNYTCCVSAVSSVGSGDSVCVSVETTTTDNVQVASKQDVLAAAASGGVFGLVLMLLLIVLIMFVTHWIHKKTRKTTTDPVHNFPADVMELKEKTSAPTTGNTQTENTYAANNRTIHSCDYKEEVVVRYQRPVLKSSNARRVDTGTGIGGKKPVMPKKPQAKAETSQQKSQQDEEPTYQPLIPSKTYSKPVKSPEYQDLAFETREPRSPQDQSPARAVSSEGQYEPVRRAEETNQYEPLTFGVSPQADSEYQALTNSSHYQNLNFTHS